mgnify:CR=1 FL=1
MFDDVNINPAGQIPGNLPVSEPEDMFAATEAPDLSQSSAVLAGKLQPKVNLPPPSTPSLSELSTPKVQTLPEEMVAENKMKNSSFTKNLMVMAIVLVGIGILGGGSFFVYTRFVKPAPEKVDFVLPDNTGIIKTEENTSKPNENVAPNNVENAQTDDSVLFGEPIDTDSDNLTDSREKELGTNPNDFDTDNDEVSDGDEVLVWKSDPLKPDTDGDGFLDGAEIKNGYNPIGPGKIFEIPKQ